MSLRYPSFLGPQHPQLAEPSGELNLQSTTNRPRQNVTDPKQFASDSTTAQETASAKLDSDLDFDLLLRLKLLALGNSTDDHDSNDPLLPSQSSYNSPFLPLTGASSGFGAAGGFTLGGFGDFPQFQNHTNTFHLPAELQGGIGNISSRRPSYAAESFTRSQQQSLPAPQFAGPATSAFHPTSTQKNSLASFAAANNFTMNSQLLQHRGLFSGHQQFQQSNGHDALADSLQNFSLNTNLSDFQARRPSQLADYQAVPQQQFYHSFQTQKAPLFNQAFSSLYTGFQRAGSAAMSMGGAPPSSAAQGHNTSFSLASDSQGGVNSGVDASLYSSVLPGQTVPLDNGLLLKDQYIMASPELKQQCIAATRYFQDVELSNKILSKLHELLANPVIQKLITFMKNLNNLTFNHKMLCLVVNKNGKLDLLSYPTSSNIFLQRDNLVIVDGDRGKDLVMILEPLVNLDFAILFNFLKKIEHLKSLTINDANGGSSVKGNHSGGTHSTSMNASAIINKHSNEDNEFIITLPTKQVLRFATPKEIQKLSGKFLEEKKAFITCYNKIKELGLNNDLTLINVEYQCDFKKLIFYYYAGFKRIDFRGLIKELFKIYKTRIWLCAVLPYDRRELYTNLPSASNDTETSTLGSIPKEYELLNEQIMHFSVKEFDKLPKPTYFHLKNMYNLVLNVESDLRGKFYGFTNMNDTNGSGSSRIDAGNSNVQAANRGHGDNNSATLGGKRNSNSRKNSSFQVPSKFDPFGENKNV